MQVRQSSVRGERPFCPVSRSHTIHSLGGYWRYARADGSERVRIPRWLCTVCGGTISVVPDERLPYVPVDADLTMRWFDHVLAGRSPPSLSEKERGCLKRTLARFTQHTPQLTLALGQIVRTITTTAAQLWTQLRRGRNLAGILHMLAGDFKTSLTGDYGCLRRWPVPG